MVCNPMVSSSSLSSITFCLRGQDSGVSCVNVRKAACGQVKMCEVLNLNRCTEIMLNKVCNPKVSSLGHRLITFVFEDRIQLSYIVSM